MKRRNSLKINDDELDRYMSILSDSFSDLWLNQKDDHPLKLLWKRNDEQSTNELYTLAHAIETIRSIDPRWTKMQIQMARNALPNNHSGAIFEFLALNMINNPTEHPVKPTKTNQAGYDGILTMRDGSETRVSIKNYGKSNSQKRFEKKAKEIEAKIKTLLIKYSYPPVQIILDFPEIYPESKEWKLLEDNIDNAFKMKREAKDPFFALVEPINSNEELSKENSRTLFILIISTIKEVVSKFHSDFRSYTLVVSAKYHSNENLNLLSKLNDACSNLTKHSATETERVINSLFIHVPLTISLNSCIKWLQEYFRDFPSKPISFVVLYQPSVAIDRNTRKSSINHAVKVFVKDGTLLKNTYRFTIPVGTISEETISQLVIFENSNGTKEEFELAKKYVYQRGEHYMKMLTNDKGEMKGEIVELAPGVHTSLVLEFPNQKERAVIHGKFPPSDELLIL